MEAWVVCACKAERGGNVLHATGGLLVGVDRGDSGGVWFLGRGGGVRMGARPTTHVHADTPHDTRAWRHAPRHMCMAARPTTH
eukprot:345147-Chlamydomonas_euryale.AAC.1